MVQVLYPKELSGKTTFSPMKSPVKSSIQDVVYRSREKLKKQKPIVEAPNFAHFEHESAKGHVFNGLVTGIQSKERGKGHADGLMKKITHHLDKHKIHARVNAVAMDDHTDDNRLKGFYKKHGFHFEPGEDHGTREPKPLKEAKIKKGKPISYSEWSKIGGVNPTGAIARTDIGGETNAR